MGFIDSASNVLGNQFDGFETGSAFSPTSLMGLISWYKSDTGITLVGGAVDKWACQVGDVSHDLIAVSPTRRPALTAGQLNGYPGVVFSSDFLMKTSAFTLNQPTTVWIVYKKITNPRGYVFDGFTDNSGALIHELNNDLFLASGALVMPTTPSSLGTFNLITSIFDSPLNSVCQVNNNTQVTGESGLLNMGGFTLGGAGETYGLFCNMSVIEIIITTTHASSGDRSNVQSYITAKYGI